MRRHHLGLLPPLIEPADLRADPLAEAVWADVATLRVTLDWARQYLCRPHPELGRKGNVCPYVEASLAKRSFLLAVHRGRPDGPGQVADLLVRYRDWFAELEPRTGPEAQFKTVLVLFPDLPADRVHEVVDGAQQVLKALFVPAGLMVGEFHDGPPDKPGLWNPDFRPLHSPVPLLAIRHMVPTDFLFLQHTEAFVAVYLARFGSRVPGYLLGPVRAAAARFGLPLPGTAPSAAYPKGPA